jgi:hypothetical protein
VSSFANNPLTGRSGTPAPAAPLAPAQQALLEALDRQLAVGTYYPQGHEKHAQAAAAVQRALASAAEERPTIAFDVDQPGLCLDGAFVPAETREAVRLHGLLAPLEVGRLEIDVAATAADLEAALNTLRKLDTGRGASRARRALEAAVLPASVRALSRMQARRQGPVVVVSPTPTSEPTPAPVAAAPEPVAPPVASRPAAPRAPLTFTLTNTDRLAACTRLLANEERPEFEAEVVRMTRELIADAGCTERDLLVARDALRTIFRTGWNGRTAQRARALLEPIGEHHHDRLGWLWLSTWEGLLDPIHREAAWPLLVDDLLAGMTWDDPDARVQLLTEVSDVLTGERLDLLVRLEALPTLRAHVVSADILDAPAPVLYPVYRLILRSSLSGTFAKRLVVRLAEQEPHPLVTLLLAMSGEYDRADVRLYQAMLDQGVSTHLDPQLADLAGRHIRGVITRLADDELSLPWVPGAITWLAELPVSGAEQILRAIVAEKRWGMIPVWPEAAREAAREGLARLAAPSS